MERTPILLKMDIRGIPLPGFSEMTDQMPPLRREKILALRDPQDRLRSLAAGLLCREALDRWSLSDLLIRYDPRGKPYVEGAANCFLSLSHSGNYALCLLCAEPCAVDIQEHLGVIEAVLKTGYSDAERRYCETAEDREAAFYELWCRKECKAKLRPYAHLRDIDSLTAEAGNVFSHFSFPGYGCAVYGSKREIAELPLWEYNL